MRIAKAQKEYSKFEESYYDDPEHDHEYGTPAYVAAEEISDTKYKAAAAECRARLRAKYDLPKEVYLFCTSSDGPLLPSVVPTSRKYIAAFVRGKLSTDMFEVLVYYFEEVAECDYGWALIERPFDFYSETDAATYAVEAAQARKPGAVSNRHREDDQLRTAWRARADSIHAEMKAVGTRSRTKCLELPRIIGVDTTRAEAVAVFGAFSPEAVAAFEELLRAEKDGKK